ncbi:glycoside hydrolase family 18 protein [Xylaria sp. FL0064]|nr:glycoside hydrolase family 18 protein [Xylaria sp. FL0064]
MIGSLLLYFTSLVAVLRLISPTAALQLLDDSEASLDTWRAANDRTSSTQTCSSSCGDDTGNLSSCIQETVIDGQTVSTPVIRGCQADYSSAPKHVNSDEVAAVCSTPNHDIIENMVTIGKRTGSTTNKLINRQAAGHLSAAYQVRNYLNSRKPTCTKNVLAFGYSQTAIIGLFSGVEVYQHGVHVDILDRLMQDLEAREAFLSPGSLVAQLCPGDGLRADYAVGIVAGFADDLTLVQEVMRSWADGQCVSRDFENYMTVSLRVPTQLMGPYNTNSSTSKLPSTLPSEAAHIWTRSGLSARTTCKTTTVKSGDGCDAVAKRCGITTANLQKYNTAKNFCTTLVPDQLVCCSSGTLPDPIPAANADGTCKTKSVVSADSCSSLASKCGLKPADFTKLHPVSNFCSTLQVGQLVCCTHGTLPDIKSKPGSDGSCATYTVKSGDSCSAIAVSHGITQANIETYNKQTWGWNGCSALLPAQKICLSTGTPPFPPSVSNAICGPQVPGTKKPASGGSDTWANLNPCPLNVCCNVWGQCGATDDFCVINKATTGAPGTTKPGKNSCISHCGQDIIKGPPPAKTINVAYFEAWNENRPCLRMDVDQIDTSKYAHIHFAFANITQTFTIDVSGSKYQFDQFKALTGVKRVITFGGWDFSTKPGTYNILREATKGANRAKFQANIVAFLKQHNLDGVDIDWEYPGAPDIPGIPAGDPEAGEDLHQTVSGLKSTLGTTKTVSVAAPASYWYLKAFPIKEIGAKIDYIVYLSYDLHGQWDYGNQWTSPGCPTGNCLRSHVNLTETKDALSLITKAGVPSNKIVVGISSYGRSFKMAQAGCTGPSCKFTGSPRVSNAAKGRCTGTGGYLSNAEIEEIIAHGRVNTEFISADSNILVYNDTEWVAYMNDSIKASRASLYASYNFAGTSDWAVDLNEFVDGSGVDNGYDPDYVAEIDDAYFMECDAKYSSLDELMSRKSSIPSYCVDKYFIDVEIKIMKDALDKYDALIDGGYDDKFNIYQDYTIEQVPVQINAFMGNGHADDFFQCSETRYRTCCSSCHYATCVEDCDKSTNCMTGYSAQDVTCPTVYKDGSQGIDYFNTEVPNVTYTLKNSDGFYLAITKDYGVEKDWIKLGDVDVKFSNGCQYSGTMVKECMQMKDDWFRNYPIPADKIEVFNPKDVVSKSYDNFQDLLFRIQLLNEIGDLDLQLSTQDVADASSLPALTIASAVDSMDKVVEQAKEIEKIGREQFIANFLGGILFFIPFVGEALGPTLAAVRAALSIAEVAGEAALLTYSVVSDPDNAFSAVFSTLAGAALSRGSWGKAANERRGLSDIDSKKLGSIHDDLMKISGIRDGLCTI